MLSANFFIVIILTFYVRNSQNVDLCRVLKDDINHVWGIDNFRVGWNANGTRMLRHFVADLETSSLGKMEREWNADEADKTDLR